jgi:hypothetical protein
MTLQTTIKEFLQESNLSRLLSHSKNRNIGLISASRAELPASENVNRREELKQSIRDAGFGYVPCRGRYIENFGTEHATPVDEDTFVVIGKDHHDNDELKNFLIKHGEKYGQDSVLFKKHDTEESHLIGTNDAPFPGRGKESHVGTFKPNRIGELHSVMKNGRPFTFDAKPQSNFFNQGIHE